MFPHDVRLLLSAGKPQQPPMAWRTDGKLLFLSIQESIIELSKGVCWNGGRLSRSLERTIKIIRITFQSASGLERKERFYFGRERKDTAV